MAVGICGLLLYQPLLAGFAVARCGMAAWQVRAALRAVDTAPDLSTLEPNLRHLATVLGDLHTILARMSPVLDRTGFVPWVGSTLSAADDLAGVAEQATTLAANGLQLVAPVLATSAVDPAALAAIGGRVSTLADELARLNVAVGELAARPLPGALAEQVQSGQAAVRLAQAAVDLGPAWGRLLGIDKPATYLILVQNNHELRATGGFISAVGAATVVDGAVSDLSFVDSYAIYQDGLAYPPAPAPMREFMGIELLLLRDANWSPDLPTAARVAATLYRQHTGLVVDGVVTVDLDGVRRLLEGFGSLHLPGRDLPITPNNVETELVQLWNRPVPVADGETTSEADDWWSQRKNFIDDLAQVATERLARRDVAWAALAHGVWSALEERGVQVWLSDPAAEDVIRAYGWDGGLHPESGADFLAIVDTNMGYNKVNAVIQRDVTYTVSWPDPAGPGHAELTITYRHPLPDADPTCRPEPHYGLRYEDMMARCYFDYLRVYVPAGSTLLETSGLLEATVSSQPGERGTQQFAGYFVQRPSTQHQVRLRYTLPPALRPDTYRLAVQRQAGTDPLPLTLQVGDATDTLLIPQGAATWSSAQVQP